MKWIPPVIFLLLPLAAVQSQKTASAHRTMIVGISQFDSVMGGGISSGSALKPGVANVNPIAWLSPSGEWSKIECSDTNLEACRRFDRDYLSKQHTYTVVSADGRNAVVSVPRMSLDHECFGYGGQGTFHAGDIRYAAIGAESPDLFADGEPARRLPEPQADAVRRGLAQSAGSKLASTKELRVYSVTLEGQSFVAIQRSFQDYADKPEYRPPHSSDMELIFAIGKMRDGQFQVVHWKENTGDDNEQILGLIHLKSGREFLVTTGSDPETYSFRVYGIRNGKLTIVFEGGGGGC